MTTAKISQQIAFFALAAVVTFSLLAGLDGLADITSTQAQQLASTMASPRV